jgi:hypothetical protein
MRNIVGVDKDGIALEEAKTLKSLMQEQEKCQILLWQTNRGFHFELIYKKEITKEENFAIREKYGDCPSRLRISKLRGEPYDVLFSIKDGNWRKLIL